MYLLLIFMFFLGCVQVLWAIIHAIITRNPDTRRHFGFYGIGVIAYFAILYLLLDVLSLDPDHSLVLLHFFGAAFSLAAYHVYIVANSRPGESFASNEDPFAASDLR